MKIWKFFNTAFGSFLKVLAAVLLGQELILPEKAPFIDMLIYAVVPALIPVILNYFNKLDPRYGSRTKSILDFFRRIMNREVAKEEEKETPAPDTEIPLPEEPPVRVPEEHIKLPEKDYTPIPPVITPEPEDLPRVTVVKPAPVDDLNVDLSFIKRHEGLMLKAYICPGDVWSIGYGSTYHPNGQKVKKGDTISKDQAQEYIEHEARTRLNKMVLPAWMNRNQRTAVLSFQYNVGEYNWNRSTLKRKIYAHAPEAEIRHEFSRWNKAKGKVLAGLTRRRKEEANLFFS